MALAKKDIEKLSEVFLTKAEAKNFATKDDLRQLRDEVLANGDKIIKIVEDIRIEQRMAYAKTSGRMRNWITTRRESVHWKPESRPRPSPAFFNF